ncbi:MAG: hypothetical protein ACFB50_13665 [Rubrobacteraceae bacterium]
MKRPFTSDVPKTVLRAAISVDHPAISAALEHLMVREGYAVELLERDSTVSPGPALLLLGDEDRSGLYVLKVRDVAAAMKEFFAGELLENPYPRTEGIRAFLPIPFGSKDVLKVVRAVSDFGTRESPGR